MDSGSGHQYPSRHPGSSANFAGYRYQNPPVGGYSFATEVETNSTGGFDPSLLEDRFFRLNLSMPSGPHQPRLLPPSLRGGMDPLDNSGPWPLPFGDNANSNLESTSKIRAGETFKNPAAAVGSDSSSSTSHRRDDNERPWFIDHVVHSCLGFDENEEGGGAGSFLHRKERSESQIHHPPTSTAGLLVGGSNRSLPGITPEIPSSSSTVLLPSWLLRDKFDSRKNDEIELAMSEILGHIPELMTDMCGNYVFQNLVKAVNDEQMTRIILALTKHSLHLIGICLNPYGTRAMQTVLDYVSGPLQISLVLSALRRGVLLLSVNSNGRHVIQQCIRRFSNDQTKYILEEIVKNCFRIATNKSGCCVLLSCLEYYHGEYREVLVNEIIANSLFLAEDPYGNYVVQNLLALKSPEISWTLLRDLEGCFVQLASNKYASNVVEKFLTDTDEEQCSTIIMEFVTCQNIDLLLIDPFGNFVVQAALQASKGLARAALFSVIRRYAPSMRANPFGRKVIGMYEKLQLQSQWRGNGSWQGQASSSARWPN
ncbi:putative pumilio homolog 8, chloroplastic isoform X2 [Diospyros lotus]|uniref:putative pumilio homolog 8, chloroplastic isoform X2 n=1 Tax=Diospyros lotus TaxID=55363 RepID=UPI002259BAD8|nr:putative pumilio homolog 8, chloroplastic isoform X2 [Diospyros lotus]